MVKRAWVFWAMATTGLVPVLLASDTPTRRYSTANAPVSYVGLVPERLAAYEAPALAPKPVEVPPPIATPAPIPAPAPQPSELPPAELPASEPTKLASVPDRTPRMSPKELATPPAEATPEVDPITRAKQTIAECKAKYAAVKDYTCTFHKRERIGGKLTPQYVMSMKARTQPHSIYFKFVRPYAGREAIYVAGKNSGKLMAHDVGLGKFVAGTLELDPKGSRAMEDNRHPVNEAGIGPLIDNVAKHWAVELQPGESVITFTDNVRVGAHTCLMIDSTHPTKAPGFMFHKVRLFIDHEHGLPIRMEAYDWPKHAGAAPDLMEEYTYMNLRTNVGLREPDFDVANSQYAFGRF